MPVWGEQEVQVLPWRWSKQLEQANDFFDAPDVGRLRPLPWLA